MLTITTPSEREIAMTRVFDAPRRLVYEAYTRPDLVKRWLGVFDGWTLPVCEIDLRVGGKARYVWRNQDGREMGMTSTYRELVPGDRIVADEKFDDPWYQGEAVGTVTLTEKNRKTTLVLTTIYDSKATRDAVLESGMDTGVSASFDKLAEVLSTTT